MRLFFLFWIFKLGHELLGHFGLIKQQLCLYFQPAFVRRTAKLTQSLAAGRDSLLPNCRVNFFHCAPGWRHKVFFLLFIETTYRNALRHNLWYFFPPLLLPAPGNLPIMSVIEATSGLSTVVLTCAATLQMSVFGAQWGKIYFILQCGMNLVSAGLWRMSAGH